MFWIQTLIKQYLDGLVPDCSNSIANALELLQYCTKPSIKSSSLISWAQYHSVESNEIVL